MPLLVTGTIGIDTVHTPIAKAEKVSGGFENICLGRPIFRQYESA